MIYPDFKRILKNIEFIEHFNLSLDEKELVFRINKPKNRLGFAVLFKTHQYLGYPPKFKGNIPSKIIKHIAEQLRISHKLFKEYIWKGRTWDYHISAIRQHTGFDPYEEKDGEAIISAVKQKAFNDHSKKYLMAEAIQTCRDKLIELPAKKELNRILNSAKNQSLEELYKNIASQIDDNTKKMMDQCLSSDSEMEGFNWLKKPPGKFGLKAILNEVDKINYLQRFKIDERYFKPASEKIITILRNRAQGEDASLMRRHPDAIGYAMFASFIFLRKKEIIDHIVTILMGLANRIDKNAKKTIEKKMLKEIVKIFGRKKLLYKIAQASKEDPKGPVCDVIFPVVGEDVLDKIIAEYENDDGEYTVAKINIMKQKYTHHYRRMMKPVLDTLLFKANNPALIPLIDGIKLVHKYIGSKITYYPAPEKIPTQIIPGNWEEVVFNHDKEETRVVRQYFEICVLQKLKKALKSKEIWVVDAYIYRNPDLDLPSDWENCRIEYYRKLNLPLDPNKLIDAIKQEMITALEKANRYFARQQSTYIYYPGRGDEKGLFKVPKIIKKPERPIIQEIKNDVGQKWGILDLLDVLVETDRQTDFMSHFKTSAQRQILNEVDARERLLLSVFSIATNMGLKRIYTSAKPSCSYDDLLYFRRRFVNPEALRTATAALVNKILEVRNPYIWGNTTACASDQKVFGAWDQNLLAEWHPHYRKTGVHVYWHVDTNSMCVYSQLKSIWASEVSSMIAGLIHHDTEMRIEKNFVDSHGQSEVAFAFCKLLGIELLPRLKNIKRERLYLPEKGMGDTFLNIKGVLERPIRWNKVFEQYDEMIHHVSGVLEKTGPVDSILRRFSSSNKSHPTYKAFIELGKAIKTIFLCNYLTDPKLRREVNDNLNVVENWNSANSFICYGRQSELQSNDPNMQEMTILGLHLLQNSLILVNTIMMDRVIAEKDMFNRMNLLDKRALTPLFTSNVNPYGRFFLDLFKPSFLEAA